MMRFKSLEQPCADRGLAIQSPFPNLSIILFRSFGTNRNMTVLTGKRLKPAFGPVEERSEPCVVREIFSLELIERRLEFHLTRPDPLSCPNDALQQLGRIGPVPNLRNG